MGCRSVRRRVLVSAGGLRRVGVGVLRLGGRAAVGIGESGGDAGGGLRLKGVTFAHLLLGKLDSVTA